MNAQAMLTFSRAIRAGTVAQWPRVLASGASLSAGSSSALGGLMLTCSAPFDARIDRGLRDVHHEIEHDEEQRQHQDRALQQRQVALENRRVEQQPGTRP